MIVLVALLILEHAEDVVCSEEEDLLVIEDELLATVLREVDAVTSLETGGGEGTVLVAEARANGEDNSLVVLGESRFRDEDRALGLQDDTLDEHTVKEGSEALECVAGCGRHLEGAAIGKVGERGRCQDCENEPGRGGE